MKSLLSNFTSWLKGLLPFLSIFIIMLILGNRTIQINRFLIIPFFAIGTVVYTILFGLFHAFRTSSKLVIFQKIFYYFFLVVLGLNLFLAIDFYTFIENPDAPFGFLLTVFQGLQTINLQLILILGFLASVNIASNYLTPQFNLSPKETNSRPYPTYIYPLLLTLFTVIGLVLRLWNLDLLDSYRDEDHHLSSIRLLFDTGTFEYTRAKLVTYTSAFFIWLSSASSYYEYLYWGRVPSAIIGALTTIPIYFLARKISKPTAIVSVLLWTISPWAIGVARNVREHSYYIFIILILVLLALEIIELVLNFDRKKLPKLLIYNLIMGTVLSYAFFVDWLSTLKVSGVILAAVVGAYVISNIDKVGRILWKRKILLVLAVLALIGLLLPISGSKFLSADKVINYKWSDTFFHPNTNTPVQWWKSMYRNTYLVYFFILIGLFVSLVKQHRNYPIYLLTFLFIVLGYHFFFDRYYSPRYISFALPFFTISIAAAVVYLFNLLSAVPLKWLRYPLQTLLVATLFNVFYIPNTTKAITNPTILDKSFVLETTGEVHNDKKKLLDFLEKRPRQEVEKKHIITSIYENVLQHELCIDSTHLHKYKYKSAGRFSSVDSIMNKYESGWLILDAHRNGIWRTGYAKQKGTIFNKGNAEVKLIQNRKLCQIYEWKTDLVNRRKYDLPATMRHFTDFSIDIGKPFTLSFWVNIPDMADAPLLFIGNIDDNGIIIDALTDQDNNTTLRFNYGSTMEGYFTKTPPLNDKEWHHVVLHHYGGAKGSPFFVFVDGKKEEAFARVPVHKSKNLEVILSQAFQGDVQDIRIYDKAIKAQQIANIYEKNAADTLAFKSITPVGTSKAQAESKLALTLAANLSKKAKIDSLKAINEAKKEAVDKTNTEVDDAQTIAQSGPIDGENNTVDLSKKAKIDSLKAINEAEKEVVDEENTEFDEASNTAIISKKRVVDVKKDLVDRENVKTDVAKQTKPAKEITVKLQKHKLYLLQVGAFKNVNRKKLKPLNTVGQLYTEKAGKLTKVLVGPYTNPQTAKKAASKIKAKGFAATQRSIQIRYPTITKNINPKELKKIKREPKLATLKKL